MQSMTNGQPSGRRSLKTSPDTISRKWIDALFLKFAGIWPRAWADTIAIADNASAPLGVRGIDAMADEWAEGLKRLTGEDIKRGIDHCRQEMPWPPAIAEFRKACLCGSTVEQRAFAARAEREQLALPSRTWAERKSDGAKSAAQILGALREKWGEPQESVAPMVRESISDEPDEHVTPEHAAMIEQRKRDALERLAQIERHHQTAVGGA